MSPKGTKTEERLKKPEEMNTEEKAKYDALSPSQQTVYRARLAAQEATEALATAKKEEEDARTKARRDRTITAAEKKLASALRSGEIKEDALDAAIKSIAITGAGAVSFNVKPPTTVREELKPTDEETAAIRARVIEAAKRSAPASTGGTRTIPAPTFKLGYELKGVTKANMIAPTDGARPDATLSALVHRFGQVLPFILLPANEAGLHPIFDGKRRYFLLKDDETVAAVVLSGFPDEYTTEAAEIATNRARSLNVFRAGEIITRARVRGKKDTEIRADMGFKTGEVDKYASAVSLPPVILEGIKAGRITANTALLIGKQKPHIIERLAAEFTERKGKETEKAPARITEADVEAMRTANSEAAVKRDAGQLSALTSGVTQADATGTEATQTVNP
jgi:hypothetical protein